VTLTTKSLVIAQIIVASQKKRYSMVTFVRSREQLVARCAGPFLVCGNQFFGVTIHAIPHCVLFFDFYSVLNKK
jgi:hypothetical protein